MRTTDTKGQKPTERQRAQKRPEPPGPDPGIPKSDTGPEEPANRIREKEREIQPDREDPSLPRPE